VPATLKKAVARAPERDARGPPRREGGYGDRPPRRFDGPPREGGFRDSYRSGPPREGGFGRGADKVRRLLAICLGVSRLQWLLRAKCVVVKTRPSGAALQGKVSPVAGFGTVQCQRAVGSEGAGRARAAPRKPCAEFILLDYFGLCFGCQQAGAPGGYNPEFRGGGGFGRGGGAM
jgi:hypothetical protein